jgi:hypothetical protein
MLYENVPDRNLTPAVACLSKIQKSLFKIKIWMNAIVHNLDCIDLHGPQNSSTPHSL